MRHAVLRRYFRHGVLPQMMVFEAIARHASLTRAAEEIHLAQPTVSVQLKKLSETVGLPLTELVGKRLYLTDAGKVLEESCAELVALFTRTEERMAALRAPEAGPLRLSVTSTGKYFLPKILGLFCHDFPDVQARLEVVNRQTILGRLASNSDDFYVLCDPPKDLDLVCHRLVDNRYRIYAPASHRFAGHRRIPFSMIASEPFVMREPGSGTRATLLKTFEHHGVEPNIRLELGSSEAVKQAVAGKLGLAMLAEANVGPLAREDDVVELDVEGFPIVRTWQIVRPEGRKPGPTAELFLNYVMEQFGKSQKRTPVAIER